jgi:hypothetical protein
MRLGGIRLDDTPVVRIGLGFKVHCVSVLTTSISELDSVAEGGRRVNPSLVTMQTYNSAWVHVGPIRSPLIQPRSELDLGQSWQPQ